MEEWIEYITEANAKIEAIAELMQMGGTITNAEFKDPDKIAFIMDRTGRAIKSFTEEIARGISELDALADGLE